MIFINVCYLFFMPFFAKAYPQIQDWKKTPIIAFENKKEAILKKNEELKSAFFVITAKGDDLQLQLGNQNSIKILENSKIQIPEVFAQAAKKMDVYLSEGTLHFNTGSDGVRFQLKTAFFDLEPPAQTEALIHVDLKKAFVEIQMIRGEWAPQFFSYEKSITLKKGQMVRFAGVPDPENHGIKYDFLLEGKKVPQGQLQAIKKFNIEQYLDVEKNLQKQALAVKAQQQEQQRIAAQKKKAYEDSFLCKNPFAHVNQCAWKLEKEKCFRKRCNVSGEWGDLTERPVTAQCTTDYLIGNCDY